MRSRVLNLMEVISSASCRCPAHSPIGSLRNTSMKGYTSKINSSTDKEYAFEMACSTIRYGPDVTKEIGMDMVNMNIKKVCVMTDPSLSSLRPVKVTLDSLARHGIKFEVYDKVRVEPTNESFIEATNFVKSIKFDAFIAVGGGSVMDTAKAANIYSCDPDAPILKYVIPPIGEGTPVTIPLKPLFAITTTSGTGSETTGVSILDYKPLKVKTALGDRALRPKMSIVDPLHTLSLPERVVAFSGFDVFCHAIESYTAIPYTERTPRPENPMQRPESLQGSNPVSDVWAVFALNVIKKYFKRAVYDADDIEARSNMHLASTMVGVGFGSAGVHLCHGLSYSIAGKVKKFIPDGYRKDHPIIPHGLSVVMSAPAVFEFCAPACPERHLEVARFLGADIINAKKQDAGKILSDVIRQYMLDMKIENGIGALGYTKEDIPSLVEGTLPQNRIIKLAPRLQSEEDLGSLFENSLTVY